jgi:5-methylcytosine-specific restriction protein A
MSALKEIEPINKQRVIDLVEAAGADISDWANFRGGKAKAASNPKYCYEWSFVVPNKLVILNLWYAEMREQDGEVVHKLNMRKFAEDMGRLGNHTLERRAITMDVALQNAIRNHLPVRVIVLEGDIKDEEEPNSKASHVHKRLLDPVSWAVTSYSWETGECTITRGVKSVIYVDQFEELEGEVAPEKRMQSGENFVRDPEVRRKALLRAQGRCELCGEPGFVTHDGRIFLESHHVIPLSEGGSDTVQNVIALCPNHHREAHHGKRRDALREELKALLK